MKKIGLPFHESSWYVVPYLFLITPVMAAYTTTQVHIIKYAHDGTTILNETTKPYQWLEANLTVLGNGITHYYSQGPTFNDTDLWDDAEYKNIDTRDWGAVKGTDLKDICALVGGMKTGDTVTIRPSDGFLPKTFPYEYIYTPNPRQGPMVITWYRSDLGYVPGYSDGMRLVEFADAKTTTYGWNTSGWHVFGNADMRDCWAPAYWYNFSGIYPSSGGVSLKYVSDIIIRQPQVIPLPGFSNPPTDPDGDDLYEDLNANARKDFNDVVLMFNQMQWIAANEPVSAFDFNGNGRIDFNDIVKLFGEI